MDPRYRCVLQGGLRFDRSLFLLLSIAALLFVGIQSRLAHDLPTAGTSALLTVDGDPVKFPPPEEKVAAAVFPAETVAGDVFELQPVGPVERAESATAFPDEAHGVGNALRAPPASR